MNRKMRAKLNNQTARRKRDRCPSEGKLVPAAPEQTHCDRCGDELGQPVAIAVLVPGPSKEELN